MAVAVELSAPLRDPAANRTRDRRNHPLGKNPTDYWYYDRVSGGRGASREKTEHHPDPEKSREDERRTKSDLRQARDRAEKRAAAGWVREDGRRDRQAAEEEARRPTLAASLI